MILRHDEPSGPHDDPVGRVHDQIVHWVADVLRTWDWEVLEGARIHADLVGRDPQGTPFVVEVKAGRGGHLGSVAQVEAYRNALGRQLQRDDTRGLLLVAGEAPKELDDVAKAAGVLLLRTDADNPDAVRKSLQALFERRRHGLEQ